MSVQDTPAKDNVTLDSMTDFICWVTSPVHDRCDGAGRIFIEDLPSLIATYKTERANS